MYAAPAAIIVVSKDNYSIVVYTTLLVVCVQNIGIFIVLLGEKSCQLRHKKPNI
jgi:hypothetical protein